MQKGLRVAIAGGGVGGLTAAAALRKAGAEPTVLERATDIRHVQLGGSIHLWPNALRALRWAGLEEGVRASVDDDAVMVRQTFESQSGRILQDWRFEEERFGFPTLAVVRGELHVVLADAVGDAVRPGAAVDGYEADGDGVTVKLADGSTERYDVLIGADGLRSRVRAGVRGEADPYYTGYTTWLAILPSTHPSLHQTVRVWFGRGGRFIAWPVTGGRTYWEGIYGAPPGLPDGPRGRRADALDRFGHWVEPIRQLIEETPEEAINRADSFARPAEERWGFGRVTLLGDAAHAMTNAVGQGANQAIEDGVVLARCLERHDDPVAGLREYEEIRRKRANTYVKRSKFVARLALVRNPLGVKGRDLFIRVAFGLAYNQHCKELGYDAGAV